MSIRIRKQNSRSADKAPGYDAWFRRQVRAGIREADRGDLIEHDEAVRMFDETLSRHMDKARRKNP